MSNEELLKKRWEVIAAFPAMMVEVGQIIPAYENGITYMIEINDYSEKYSMNDFPHLFKKLGWWEKRKVEDMPAYVKQTDMADSADNPLPDVYLKVKKHFSAGNGEWRDDSIHIFCADSYISPLQNCSYSYSGWLPATEQEYLSNLEQLESGHK